jgi:hypothetical protein
MAARFQHPCTFMHRLLGITYIAVIKDLACCNQRKLPIRKWQMAGVSLYQLAGKMSSCHFKRRKVAVNPHDFAVLSEVMQHGAWTASNIQDASLPGEPPQEDIQKLHAAQIPPVRFLKTEYSLVQCRVHITALFLRG